MHCYRRAVSDPCDRNVLDYNNVSVQIVILSYSFTRFTTGGNWVRINGISLNGYLQINVNVQLSQNNKLNYKICGSSTHGNCTGCFLCEFGSN